MTDWGVQRIIITILIASSLIIGMSSFYGGMLIGSNVTDNSTAEWELRSINLTNQTTGEVNNVSGAVEESLGDDEITLLEIPYVVAKGAYKAVKLMFNSIDIAGSMLSDFADILSMPGWFFTLIGTLVGVVVTFALLSVLLKYRIT